MDIIHHVKNKLLENTNGGYVLLGLSKAFGEINRNKIWWVLYGKGLPINLIKNKTRT